MPTGRLEDDRMSVAIRSARTADLDFIVDCNARLAQETESKQLNARVLRMGVQSALDSEHKGRYFIAELESQPVGQLLLTHEWSDWRNGFFWWFQSVYVVREARRHGVFAALYRHVEELARNSPEVCGLRLYVEQHNHNAQQIYQRLGLTLTAYQVMELEFNRPQGGA
jgi:GNAT superfamily N-acetyltransferase